LFAGRRRSLAASRAPQSAPKERERKPERITEQAGSAGSLSTRALAARSIPSPHPVKNSSVLGLFQRPPSFLILFNHPPSLGVQSFPPSPTPDHHTVVVVPDSGHQAQATRKRGISAWLRLGLFATRPT
jgi:hypothetical protein